MNKKLIDAIRSERPGTPVWLPDLRKRVTMSKKAFDASIMELAKSGQYFLNKHCHPAQTNEQEKAEFISDGHGNYFITINPRDDSDILDRPGEPDTAVDSSTIITRKAETPPEKPGRGGSREGAGRPVKKTKIKRVPLQGARIPGWLMEWLKAEGDAGRKIEVALIEKYGLTPPT